MVPPGAVLQDSVRLLTTHDVGLPCRAPVGRCGPYPLRAHITGWFQIEYGIHTGQRGDPGAILLPEDARRTNPFEIRRPG
jgi:hypothetical protein